MKEEPLLLLSDLQKLINQVVLIDYTIIILGSGVIMKIEGTREEIAWVKEAIKNSCSRCPFLESCNKQAKEEGANGNLKSCEEFLRHKIKYVVENE